MSNSSPHVSIVHRALSLNIGQNNISALRFTFPPPGRVWKFKSWWWRKVIVGGISLQFEWQSWRTMEHININSSGSVYHILHWVGWALGEWHKSCRITQSSLESLTRPEETQWVLFNQFVFVWPNQTPGGADQTLQWPLATCHYVTAHHIPQQWPSSHQERLARGQSQVFLTPTFTLLKEEFIFSNYLHLKSGHSAWLSCTNLVFK